MVITPHMLIGAAIGSQSSNLLVAFGLGLVSHFLLDILPHWDYIDDINFERSVLKKIALDFVLGSVLVLIFAWSYNRMAVIMMAAIFGALLPDFLIALSKLFENKYLSSWRSFHHKIHIFKKLSFWQGLPATISVILIAIMFLLRVWG